VELSGADILGAGEFVPFKDVERMLYIWLPLENIDKVKIYPKFLGGELSDLAKYPKHFRSSYC
ncbi:MAG: hypothetical protein J6C89_02905, partial [Clostridia bacterium]|nr:hypothetical protein [Clostridia bacterium]